MAQESKMTKEEHLELKAKMQKAAGDDTIDRLMKELNVDAIVGTMEMVLVGFASLAGKFIQLVETKPHLLDPALPHLLDKILILNLGRIPMCDNAPRCV